MLYRVTWEIDIDAANPTQAAQRARAIQMDHHAQVGAFDVRPHDKEGAAKFGATKHVDLTPGAAKTKRKG